MIRLCLLWLVCGAVACGTGNRGATQCRVDGECPLHQWCDRGQCATGCLGSQSCAPELECNDHGRCVSIVLSPGSDLGAGDGAASDGSAAQDLATDSDQSLPDLSPPDLAMSRDLSTPPDLSMSRDLSMPRDLTVPVDLTPAPDLLMSCQGQMCPEQGNNGDIVHATLINENATVGTRSICPQGNVDFFKVVATHAGTLHVTLTGGPCGWSIAVDIMNALGQVIGSSVPAGLGASASAAVANGQVLYIRVQAVEAAGTNYYDLQLGNN